MSARRRILAVFRSEAAAAEAADALLRRGLDEQHLSLWELAPGRYLMEDAADPERRRKIRVDFVLGGLAGVVAGVVVVLLALWGSVTPVALLVGALGGLLMGLVAGGVVAANEVPMGDNEDQWLTVTDLEHSHVIEADAAGTMPPHTVHAVLREHGARAFLMPDAAPEQVELSAPHAGR